MPEPICLYGVYRITIDGTEPDTTETLSWADGRVSFTSTEASLSDPGNENYSKWIIYPVSAPEEGAMAFRITSFDGGHVLSCEDNPPRYTLSEPSGAYTTWNIEFVKDGSRCRIWTDEHPNYYTQAGVGAESDEIELVHCANEVSAPFSGWKFEKLPDEVPDVRAWSGIKALRGMSFQEKFFRLTLEEANWEQYDIIIVGSGIGGGVLVNDLYDTNLRLGKAAKRILLLEKGGLVFHSHCLNTARPAGLMNDRGQQNDTFFQRFKHNYKFEPPLVDEVSVRPQDDSKKQAPWNGGPMYSLGGRSAAWGLFSPRIHDKVLDDKFPHTVAQDLRETYYAKAERLMLLSLPTTRRAHQHIMDRLNSKCREVDGSGEVQWQWGRIASEFKDDRNFDFAEGAYSTIDKLLEIAMSRPKAKVGEDEVLVEHRYFKAVLGADVHSLEFDSDQLGSTVTGVRVRGANGLATIKLRDKGKVILCGGSVGSPAILLRSQLQGLEKKLADDWNGLHLTDHTILYFQCPFRYKDPTKRSEYGAMKLQTYVKIGQQIALANISIDASSFLPRGHAPDENLPKFIMVFILQQELVEKNTIKLDRNGDPLIKLEARSDPLGVEQMQQFTLAAMKALSGSGRLEFVGFEDFKAVDDSSNLKKIQLGLLPLGGVAHELGTLPMASLKDKKRYCLEDDLAVRSELCKGVYVCDLSCFPHSPESNPTLTLAALAIRLSRHLNPRRTVVGSMSPECLSVVNHSGSKVKVFLSHYKPDQEISGAAEKAEVLQPGEQKTWNRPGGVPQGLFVYKLDRSDKPQSEFLKNPIIYEAHPGKLTTIRRGG